MRGIWNHTGSIWEVHGRYVGGSWEAYRDISEVYGMYMRGMWGGTWKVNWRHM